MAHAYPSRTGGFGLLDGDLVGPWSNYKTESVIGVDYSSGRMIAHCFDLRTWIDQPTFEHLEIRRQPSDAVRIDSPHVGGDEHVCCRRCVLFRDFTTDKDARRKLAQAFNWISIHLSRCDAYGLQVNS